MARTITKPSGKTTKADPPQKRKALNLAAPDPRDDLEVVGQPRKRVTLVNDGLIAGLDHPVAEELSGKTVTVLIPKDFTLTDDAHQPSHYKAGIDEMPLEHADHWFAKAQGVEIYDPKKKQVD